MRHEMDRLLRGSPKCDFCNSPKVQWIFPADSVSVETTDDMFYESKGAWIACAQCKTIVDNGKMVQMVNHMIDSFVRRSVGFHETNMRSKGKLLKVVRKQAALAYKAFRKARKGEAVPFG